MKFGLVAMALAAVLMLAASPLAGAGPSASGGGSTLAGILGKVTFGFTAVTHRDGRVTGNFWARSTSTSSSAKMNVQCLDIQGNKATFGGSVRKGNLLGTDLTGLCYVVSAQDNGEGANSPPDLVSFVSFNTCGNLPPDSACSTGVELTILEVRGNIQVRP